MMSLRQRLKRILADLKMLLSKLFSKVFNSSKPYEIRLPTEIWTHIWSFLDFNTCQKICIHVSKEWLYQIRNSTRLSSEMILRLEDQSIEDINNVLSRWPKLKVLHVSDCNDSQHRKLVSLREKLKKFALTTEMRGINLTEQVLLRKLVGSESMRLVELGNWGKATIVWFDPNNWTPTNLESVINLQIYVDCIPGNFEIGKIGKFLINVENLYITRKRGMAVTLDSYFILSLSNFLLGFKKLTKVSIKVEVKVKSDKTYFLNLLNSIANVKTIFSYTKSESVFPPFEIFHVHIHV